MRASSVTKTSIPGAYIDNFLASKPCSMFNSNKPLWKHTCHTISSCWVILIIHHDHVILWKSSTPSLSFHKNKGIGHIIIGRVSLRWRLLAKGGPNLIPRGAFLWDLVWREKSLSGQSLCHLESGRKSKSNTSQQSSVNYSLIHVPSLLLDNCFCYFKVLYMLYSTVQ
jgi:hypothetical protein